MSRLMESRHAWNISWDQQLRSVAGLFCERHCFVKKTKQNIKCLCTAHQIDFYANIYPLGVFSNIFCSVAPVKISAYNRMEVTSFQIHLGSRAARQAIWCHFCIICFKIFKKQSSECPEPWNVQENSAVLCCCEASEMVCTRSKQDVGVWR